MANLDVKRKSRRPEMLEYRFGPVAKRTLRHFSQFAHFNHWQQILFQEPHEIKQAISD